METSSPYRPRVSRETRLLLTAGVMAVAALWLLARIRFPERPVTPNPVPSVLSQLASGPTYDDLAREIAQLHARLQSSLLARDVPSALGGWLTLGAGGFLVGFGSRWAGGCTSGHAISGLATFQLPSRLRSWGFFAGGLVMTHVLMPLFF